ncbi:MAG TPA: tetratricopeptide repeat protein [Bacteroidales bacterium]|nr:tetratricopeptide repeat protein [Bacteroidales bacterium]
MIRYWRTIAVQLFLISTVSMFAQDQSSINRLKQELKIQTSDTAKIRVYIALANLYATSNTDSALSNIGVAQRLAKGIHCSTCDADIFLQEGIIHTYSSDYSAALPKFEKALALYHKLDIKNKVAWSCIWIGAIHGESLNYTKTMDYYTEAMDIFRSLNDREGIAHSYYMMATVYAFQNNSKTAIDYDKKALALVNKTDKERVARYYLSLFRDYKTEGLYTKAQALVDSFIPPLKETNNLFLLAQSHCYVGALYLDLKDYKKAKAYIHKASEYDNQFGNKRSLMITKLNLAQVHLDAGENDSAIVVLKGLLDLNQQLKSMKYADMIYYNLAYAYEQKGDYKSALDYCNRFIMVNDSVVQELTNRKLLEMQTKYEVDIKNEQIKLLEKEKQLTQQRYISLAIGLLLILLVSLYIIGHKHRKAKEKQLRYETEIQEATDKIGTKQRELTLKAMQIAQQENSLSFLRDQLESFNAEHPESQESMQGLLSRINLQLKQNAFNDFERYFIEVHPEFYSKLKRKYEELSQNELRVCALLRLNLSSKQIADITGRSVRSVESTRTNIRKKMGLTLQDNLFEAISAV